MIIKTEIPLNKSKLKLTLAGAFIFVAIGLWFIIAPPVNEALWNSPILFRSLGAVCLLFFALCAVIISKKIKDPNPGLIIDSEGITDNASGVSAGFIPWKDITGFKSTEVFTQKFIMVTVSNPNDYIDRQTNSLKRKAMAMNYKTYGSPISIPKQSLDYDFTELEILLAKSLESKRR